MSFVDTRRRFTLFTLLKDFIPHMVTPMKPSMSCFLFFVLTLLRVGRAPCTGLSIRMTLKHPRPSLSGPYTAIFIVPTGIGAAIGGYAGDALPAAKLASTVVDTLITHPNVMNAAMLYWPVDNILYVEGFALDEFAAGRLGLLPVTKRGNRIGLLLDGAMEEDLKHRHLQVADAFRASLGIDVAHCCVTSRPVGVEVGLTKAGASWGRIHDEDTLLEGATELVRLGCNAIACVARFPEDEELDDDDDNDNNDDGNSTSSSSSSSSSSAASLFDAYRKGQGVDAIAGAEALISHVITQSLNIPCAHAPAFAPAGMDVDTSPKAAAEELGYTFLPCVLAYLHKAPALVPLKDDEETEAGGGVKKGSDGDWDVVANRNANMLRACDVDACVVPASALGGPAVLSMLARGTLVIAVEENTSAMKVTAEDLKLTTRSSTDWQEKQCVGSNGKSVFYNVVKARSYTEAVGLLTAHKAGILFESLTTSVPRIPVKRL